MIGWLSWNPSKEIFYLPLIHHPITWYGIILALGCAVGYTILNSLYEHYLTQNPSKVTKPNIQLQVKEFCESISTYCLVGIIIGARLGHILFYESVYEYITSPARIFMIWEGGISSHGAIVGVGIAIWYYLYRLRSKNKMSFLQAADLLTIPIMLGMAFVRFGNFINQEAIGIYTSLPWGIVFESPLHSDGGIPRHPVQIYEAITYAGLFYFLRRLYIKNNPASNSGKIAALFLSLGFTIRFFLEYLKEDPMCYLQLNVGQWLSIPFILIGGIGFLYRKKASSAKET